MTLPRCSCGRVRGFCVVHRGPDPEWPEFQVLSVARVWVVMCLAIALAVVGARVL